MSLTFRSCLIILAMATAAYAQNASRPEFEAASVRLSDPENLQIASCCRFIARRGRLRSIR